VSSVEGLQQVERLSAADLADDDAIRTVTEGSRGGDAYT
jgi:hypothetical protein